MHAAAAREANMLVMREFVEAPLVYETGGMFPPVRFCPRTLQRMARSTAEADLQLLLQTPVLPPTEFMPPSMPPAVNSHRDGHASSPLIID